LIAFEVSLNGERLTVAGAEDLGSLFVIVTAAGKLGPSAVLKDERLPKMDISFSAHGYTSRGIGVKEKFHHWIAQSKLEVGDEMLVKVLDTDSVDKSSSFRELMQRERGIDVEREMFESSKQVYFELRDKYENKTDATS